jgi:hypothetical protein
MPKIVRNFLVSRASFKPFLRARDAGVLAGVFIDFFAGAGRAFVLLFDMICIDLW